jgi:hypothetical protein
MTQDSSPYKPTVPPHDTFGKSSIEGSADIRMPANGKCDHPSTGFVFQLKKIKYDTMVVVIDEGLWAGLIDQASILVHDGIKGKCLCCSKCW